MNDILKGLSDGTFRARWLREVLRTSQITESVKVLLISLAVEEMDAAGCVSVPREDLAVRIGRGKARVSERMQSAVDAGFLVRLSTGKKGNTAVYAAALKGSACSDPIKGPPVRTETSFGSGLQDALDENTVQLDENTVRTAGRFDEQKNVSVRTAGRFDADEVRIGGPNEQKKGPLTRAANVVKEVEVGEVSKDSTDEGLFKVEDAASRRATKKRTKRTTVPKIPLPADFAPDDAMRAWARQKCPLINIDAQTEAFIIHFTPEPGEKPVVRPGWGRSWKAWMARQQGWAVDRQANVHTLRPTGTDGRASNGSGSQLPARGSYNAANVFKNRNKTP